MVKYFFMYPETNKVNIIISRFLLCIVLGRNIYTTIEAAFSQFHEFLAARSQFDTNHDQIWQAYADRSGNGSYLNKLAP